MYFEGRSDSIGGWVGYWWGVNGIEELKKIVIFLIWVIGWMELLFIEMRGIGVGIGWEG